GDHRHHAWRGGADPADGACRGSDERTDGWRQSGHGAGWHNRTSASMIEVRIPCSPTPAMLNRVRLIAASVRQWEPDAVVQVSCYPCRNIPPSCRWSTPSPSEFESWSDTRSPFMATIMDTWRSGHF